MKDLSLLSCTLLLSVSLKASDTLQYTRQHYTDENGLPQNSIKFIAPDKSGFVWLATEKGVVRFDGQHFRAFNKDNIPVSSSRIYIMGPGSCPGNLYALTEVKQLIQIHNGEAQVSNTIGRMAGWALEGDRYGRFMTFHALGLPNIYKDLVAFQRYMLPVNNRDFFLISGQEIAYYHKEQCRSRTWFPHNNLWRFFNLDSILYYVEDEDVYSIAGDGAIRKGKLKGDIVKDPGYGKKGKLQLYWNHISKNVFVYLERSLYLVKRSASGELHTQLLLTGFNLPQNSIVSVYYEEDHRRLFLGSLTSGLFVFTRKQFNTLTSSGSETDEVHYAQTSFGHSGVLTPLGEVMGGPEHGKKLPALHQLHAMDRYSLLTDNKGCIWMKLRYDLYKISKDGQRIESKWKFTSLLHQLYEHNSKLWIGTDSGLYVMDLQEKDPTPQFFTNRVLDISYLQHETGNVLWLGTGKGLYRLTLSNHRMERIEGMGNKYVRNLYIPRPGEIWITTAEEGIYLLRRGRLTRFPVDQGHYLYASHCFVEDDQGYAWITTNKGLFRVARKDLLDYADNRSPAVYYHYYDKYTGFNTNEFNGGCQPCAVKLPDGHLSFPSMNGLVQVRPEQAIMELPDKDIFVDRVELDGKLLTRSDTFVLSRQFDLLKMFVSTPYFGNPYNLHLEFALDRNTDNMVWNRIGNDGSISLASLPSGSYQLRIRKLNGPGRNNYCYKNITLIVPPAYYEAWWFRTCIIALIGICIWGYTRFRLQYIRHKNKLLESRIDERTTALKNTLSELQASEEALRKQMHIQERLITAITHDIKSPLRYMMLAAKRLTDSTANTGNEGMDVHKNAQMLYEAGYRMYHLTDNLLQYIKLSGKDRQVVLEEVNLIAVITGKVEIFRDIAATQGTELLSEVKPGINVIGNFHLLGVIIHNLLDNAVKVTFEGKIRIFVVPDDPLRLVIEDTGIGMRPEMINWCNAELTPGDRSVAAMPGHGGFGLLIIKELLVLMGAKLWVTSDHKTGTRVELLFKEWNDKGKGISY